MRYAAGFACFLILIALSVIQMRSKQDSRRFDFTVAAIFAFFALIASYYAS